MPAATQNIEFHSTGSRVTRKKKKEKEKKKKTRKPLDHLSVYDTNLACIYEIRPVIDNDILKILGDFGRFCPYLTTSVSFFFFKTCPDLAMAFASSLIVRGPLSSHFVSFIR